MIRCDEASKSGKEALMISSHEHSEPKSNTCTQEATHTSSLFLGEHGASHKADWDTVTVRCSLKGSAAGKGGGLHTPHQSSW